MLVVNLYCKKSVKDFKLILIENRLCFYFSNENSLFFTDVICSRDIFEVDIFKQDKSALREIHTLQFEIYLPF